jgi:phytoene dehydrogenase-like protein
MQKKVIIIGGGVSGLTAGIYARNSGFETEIYESHTVAGGMCTGWQRNGYLIDGCIHWLTGSKKGSDLYRIWETCGALGDTADVVHHDYVSACCDGDAYRYLFADLPALEREFLSISPEDEKAIKSLVETVRIFQKLPIPAGKPLEQMGFIEKIRFYAPYIKAGKRLADINKTSIEAYLVRFRSPIIRHLLASAVPHHKLSANALLFSLATFASRDGGFPLGGSLAMAQRMKDRFVSMGGIIHLGTPVKRIIINKGRAVGVETEAGFAEADYLIPAVSFDVLLDKLLEGKFRDRYFENRLANPDKYPTLAATVAAFGVNADLSKYPHNLYIKAQKPLRINKTLIDELSINHYCYDATFSAGGKSLVEVLFLDSEFDYWQQLKAASAADYRKAKEEIAAHLLAEIATVYPEVNGNVEMTDVATPLTFHRYCSTWRGAYMMSLSTAGGASAKNHRGKIKGIKNMYLAGQWVFSNGGLPMAVMAGKFAVQRMVADL